MADQANGLLGLATASLSRDYGLRPGGVPSACYPARGEITLIGLRKLALQSDPRGHSCRARRRRVACAMGVDDAGLADAPGSGRARRPQARRGARISAPSRRRSCSPAIAPARAATKGRRDWRRIAAQVRSPASCASTTPTAARARRRLPHICVGVPARQGRPASNKPAAVRRRAPTMQRSRAEAAGCDSACCEASRPEKPASRRKPRSGARGAQRQRGRQATAPAPQAAPAAPPAPEPRAAGGSAGAAEAAVGYLRLAQAGFTAFFCLAASAASSPSSLLRPRP